MITNNTAWANGNESEQLSQAQITQRLMEIDSSYDVGEPFSAEDAAFVLAYASRADDVESSGADSNSPRGSHTFTVSGTKYGTTVTASGNLYHNGVTPSYTYGGNVTIRTTAGSTPKRLKLTVHCTSYGIVGENGFGKIYDGQVSASKKNAKTFKASPKRTYSGFMNLYSVYGWVDVTTSNGNFFTIS